MITLIKRTHARTHLALPTYHFSRICAFIILQKTHCSLALKCNIIRYIYIYIFFFLIFNFFLSPSRWSDVRPFVLFQPFFFFFFAVSISIVLTDLNTTGVGPVNYSTAKFSILLLLGVNTQRFLPPPHFFCPLKKKINWPLLQKSSIEYSYRRVSIQQHNLYLTIFLRVERMWHRVILV